MSCWDLVKTARQVGYPVLFGFSDGTKNSETAFGNCAETYPFRSLLGVSAIFVHSDPFDICQFTKSYGGNCVNVYGIGLQYKGVHPVTYQDNLSGATWRRVVDPCSNCKEFLMEEKQTTSEDIRVPLGRPLDRV